MNISIQTVHFDADKKLLEFVQKKLDKLETFNGRITKAEVYLKLESLAHTIKEKVVEIKIHIPKQACFVKASASTFQTAFDQAFDAVVNQLKKKKERMAA
ncbi:MAG: ribosome hibernation-promoting factor, HPF/YfiA family [Sediminibacterium sp.]